MNNTAPRMRQPLRTVDVTSLVGRILRILPRRPPMITVELSEFTTYDERRAMQPHTTPAVITHGGQR